MHRAGRRGRRSGRNRSTAGAITRRQLARTICSCGSEKSLSRRASGVAKTSTDQHEEAHDDGDEAQDRAGHLDQLVPTLAAAVLAEDRHQRRAQHAADEQVVDHGRHARGQAERVELAAGAKEARNDRLACQADHPARDVAHAEDTGRARKPGTGAPDGLGSRRLQRRTDSCFGSATPAQEGNECAE